MQGHCIATLSKRGPTYWSLLATLVLNLSPVSCCNSGVAFQSTGNGDEATKSDNADITSDAGCIRPNSIVNPRPERLLKDYKATAGIMQRKSRLDMDDFGIFWSI